MEQKEKGRLWTVESKFRGCDETIIGGRSKVGPVWNLTRLNGEWKGEGELRKGRECLGRWGFDFWREIWKCENDKIRLDYIRLD